MIELKRFKGVVFCNLSWLNIQIDYILLTLVRGLEGQRKANVPALGHARDCQIASAFENFLYLI